MTSRPHIAWGALIALLLSPGAACYADEGQSASSESTITLVSAHVPEITVRQDTQPAEGTASTWQRSTQERVQETRGEIRFNKPVIASADKSVTATASKSASLPSNESAVTRGPSAKWIVAAPAASPVEEKTERALDQRPDVSPTDQVPQISLQSRVEPTVIASDQVGTTSGARTIAFTPPHIAEQEHAAQVAAAFHGNAPERPQVTQAIASEQPQQSAEPAPLEPATTGTQVGAATPWPYLPQSSSSVESSDTRSTDERMQLISRILSDNQVQPAAQDVSLAPDLARGGAGNVGARPEIKGGPELGDSAAFIDACPSPRPRLFWTAGVEATFLSPDLNSDGVSFEVEEQFADPDIPNRYDLCSTSADDVDSMYVSPRIWLGVQGCAWGANLRYWHLQAAEGSFDPSIGGLGMWDDFDCGRPDLGFSSCSNLEAYTIDLELTRRFCVHDCAMQGTVGLRHADIQHNESLFGLANTEEGLLAGTARANRLSRGTGILLGLYGRKPIYQRSCVHWFYNARWSALWGPTQTSVETFASVMATDPNATGAAASVNGAYTNVDDMLFVGEIQLGLEWNYALQCVPAKAFFRTAIEYQRWDGGLGVSQSQSFAGAEVGNQIAPELGMLTASASAAEPQMDLVGISLGTGLTW